MRVLMVGTVNSPHVTDLAADLRADLDDLTVAGWISPDLPPPRQMAGVRVLVMGRLQLSRIGAPFRVMWQSWLFRTLRPDLVHVHGATELAVAAIRAGARPLLVTVWGSEVLAMRDEMRAATLRALTGADAFTADSPLLLGKCVAIGADRQRGRLVGWGVDLGRFGPVPGGTDGARMRLGLPDGRLVLSPRATRPLYNTAELVEAFDMLADDDPGLQLVLKHPQGQMTGPPPSRHPERVHVIGDLPRERMPDVYAAADVCVSIPSSDSAPRTVWEAMACGCPCLLSDLPWLEGMVQADREALVVSPRAPEVAAALRRLLDEPDLASSIAARARMLVEREHNSAEQRTRWLSIYRELTSCSSASA